jgi:hypothetical protein
MHSRHLSPTTKLVLFHSKKSSNWKGTIKYTSNKNKSLTTDDYWQMNSFLMSEANNLMAYLSVYLPLFDCWLTFYYYCECNNAFIDHWYFCAVFFLLKKSVFLLPRSSIAIENLRPKRGVSTVCLHAGCLNKQKLWMTNSLFPSWWNGETGNLWLSSVRMWKRSPV